uniref:ATP-dependent Clp protease proteolytic subunit n=1 Tax=Oryza meridionalis TaxID=40149 RepID=A0A0E0D237_9ORYZ
MAPMAISTPLALRASPTRLLSRSPRLGSSLPSSSSASNGAHGHLHPARPPRLPDPPPLPQAERSQIRRGSPRKNTIVASENENPPLMPAIMTPAGALDLATVLLGNRIIFIGQYINSQVAQRVISQLVTLAAVDEEADILIYLNCPGGSLYSILAIYDCMSWIKPKVGTVCFGVVASQAAIILAGGEKGMRYAMPNARVMIHQPQGGSEGNVEEVRRQVGETIYARDKVDKMFAAFTGQTLDMVQQWTERDRFMSSSEAMDFGLVDALLETRY